MATIKHIDHIAIVVADIDTALTFWRDRLGLPLTHIETIAEQQSRVAFMPVGNSKIELVQPTGNDSGIARFLAKHGGGLHHIALEVDDLEGMLADLKAAAVQLINDAPVAAAGGSRAVFIHPKATGGVLVELYEKPNSN